MYNDNMAISHRNEPGVQRHSGGASGPLSAAQMSGELMNATLPYYHPISNEIEVFNACFQKKLPFLIKGPTGVGKSRFIEHMAARMKAKLISVACHEETSAVDLLGRFILKGNETLWQDGPLTRAVREGAIVYLDEIAEARPDVIVAIHSLTDHRRRLFLDRKNEEIAAHPDFMLVASFNPGYQAGWKELKPSTRQRFVGMSFQHPPAPVEVEILEGETGLEASQRKKLVKLAQKIRNLTEMALTESVSTRLLVDAGKLIQAGLPPRQACMAAIVEPLSDDQEIIDSLGELVALIF